MKRRIGGAGGGSDPAPKKGGPLLAAAVLAGSMAVAGGGLGAGGASLGTSSPRAANTAAGKARKANSRKAAIRGNVEEAWRRLGVRRPRRVREGKERLDCLGHSFGEVRAFFLRNPCRALNRKLFGVSDGSGNIAAVSVVSVTMPSRGQARRFQRTIDVHGSGDIEPLPRTLLKSHDTGFTGLNYDSRLRGTTTVIAETETASGHFSPSALDAIAEIAALVSSPRRRG